MKNERKINVNNLIYAKEAGKILGVSAPTFKKRLLLGAYGNKIHAEKFPNGWKFYIYDVMEIAHPRASDDQIERFIREFRDKKYVKKVHRKFEVM